MAIVMIVAIALGGALLTQVGRLGAHAVAQARAEIAAAAAALAAADALALGRGAHAARRVAIDTAEANGASLRPTDCTCTGRVVTVEVTVSFRQMGPIRAIARARARAEIRPVFADFAR
ncbi:MAG TPA: hypothetical protein VI916_02550 [Acidimicrobiia bacterium]|nr:hypothetical protein [Acidimicrobiia bacterium]